MSKLNIPDKIVDLLTREGGAFTINYNDENKLWGVGIEFGKEAPDSDMAGGAAYGMGDTPQEAVDEAAKDISLMYDSPDPNKLWYLGGPMSGYPEFNFPAFDKAEAFLREQGLTVVSAHKIDHGIHTGAGTQPWSEYMRGDLLTFLRSEGLILLPEWASSKGARIEFELAVDLQYPIWQLTANRFIPLCKESWYN